MGNWLYLGGLALVVAGFLFGRVRAGNSVRARDISGTMVIGDVSGSVSQNASFTAAEGRKTRGPAESGTHDRIAWLIGIVGVLVALAQLAHDVLAGK